MSRTKEQRVIDKFQSLLRSGMDYDVNSMYEEAGESVCIAGVSARRIVNNYYKGIVSEEMIIFFRGLTCSHAEKVELFSKKFETCERESRLLMRYIKWKK